jgi:hypothetical protein
MENPTRLMRKKRLEKTFSRSTGARMEPIIAASTAMAKARPIARNVLRTIIRPLVYSRHVNANGLEARLL